MLHGSPLIGLDALAMSMAVKRTTKGFVRPVHYSPRSDYHSKVTSVLMTIDLMQRSEALRRDVGLGRLVMGVNAVLRDHGTGRKKALDLVIGTPGDKVKSKKVKSAKSAKSLKEMVSALDLVLDATAATLVAGLPDIPVAPIGQVRVAMEAKACMTEHRKAGPRLYDELTSSHTTVHGNSPRTISAGFVMVNDSETFLSPTRNENYGLGEVGTPFMNKHHQPDAASFTFKKLSELQIRGGSLDVPGFDGLAVVAITTDNDTGGFRISPRDIDKTLQERFSYSGMIDRIATLYDQLYGAF